MKRFADEVFALLASNPAGLTIDAVVTDLASSRVEVRRAFEALETKGLARVVKKGAQLRLIAKNDGALSCVVCRKTYERNGKSRRITCSRTCAVALSWKNLETAKTRRASIIVARNTEESKKRATEINNKRWADPKQRDRLSKWNRERWADPVTRAKQSIAISKVHGTPENRKRQSDRISARWNDPKGREKLLKGIRASKGSPEWKREFRKILKRRWADKRQRVKLLAAARRNGAKAHGERA